MLIEKIKADMITARQGSDAVAKSLLVTLFAEAQRVGKDKRNGHTTDEECMGVIRKFAANAEETCHMLQARGKDVASQHQELLILRGYLPQQLTEQELIQAVQKIVMDNQLQGTKAMGQVMAALKAEHGGKYDGKMASDIVKKVLA